LRVGHCDGGSCCRVSTRIRTGKGEQFTPELLWHRGMGVGGAGRWNVRPHLFALFGMTLEKRAASSHAQIPLIGGRQWCAGGSRGPSTPSDSGRDDSKKRAGRSRKEVWCADNLTPNPFPRGKGNNRAFRADAIRTAASSGASFGRSGASGAFRAGTLRSPVRARYCSRRRRGVGGRYRGLRMIAGRPGMGPPSRRRRSRRRNRIRREWRRPGRSR
jgi:hypothetical protein